MKVSLNWLKDYVEIRMDLKELIHLLTMAGLEVEEATSMGEGFEKVIVAEIHSIRKHPNADRLSLVEAKTHQETFSIVCGATNIREGQKVPLALVGARLPNGIEIKRSKIRGVPSEGMLCSEIELALGQDASGIMILPPSCPSGNGFGRGIGFKGYYSRYQYHPQSSGLPLCDRSGPRDCRLNPSKNEVSAPFSD